jgi:DNA recombination protein RmuC
MFLNSILGVYIVEIIILLLIMTKIGKGFGQSGDGLTREEIENERNKMIKQVREEINSSKTELHTLLRENREELANSFNVFMKETSSNIKGLREQQEQSQQRHVDTMNKLILSTEEKLSTINDTTNKLQEKTVKTLHENHVTTSKNLTDQTEKILQTINEHIVGMQRSNATHLEKINENVEKTINSLQESNNKRLEEIRKTVDEKLHDTLEKRLGASFKMVSEHLEKVQRGLGEMQTLANGVGDLKRVLGNVKTRGSWGEVQLHNILEQMLTAEQYDVNVITKPKSKDRVEFAIKIPAKSEEEKTIYLPIDSKFPLSDYENLLQAYDEANQEKVVIYRKQLENNIKNEARKISEKYVEPPFTTDFAIMFLGTEGLYAEVLRIPGLVELLQREYRIVLSGPTTLTALLNALQVGFRTLAIEKRSSEVWKLLGMVKTEFGKFGDLLDKTHKKMQEATNKLEEASRKSRNIERKLTKVEEVPVSNTFLIDEVIPS